MVEKVIEREKPKPAGEMKKIGVAVGGEGMLSEGYEGFDKITGEVCWMVQLCTLGDAVGIEVKDPPKDDK